MQKIVSNPSAATVEAVRAHVASRVDLLASCARMATGLNNSASKWARAELIALSAGLTDRIAIQAAVCEKFPKVTANAKVSKTPNSSFKTSFDKFVLLADVIAGTHKTYASDGAKAIAASFVSDDKVTLNDAVDRIKADHAATGREERANEGEEAKAARIASEEAAMQGQIAGTVTNSGAIMLALAERIDGMDAEACLAFAEPLVKLMEAAERAVGRSIDAERQELAQAA